MSSIVHKVKDAITPNKTSHGTHDSSLPEGSTGPHQSRVANTADPRIDSDKDHRGAIHDHSNTGYTANDSYTYGSNTSSGLTGSHTTGTGPVHNSNAANKLDPRVNSQTAPTGTSGLTGNTHTTGTTGLNNHSTTHGTAHGTAPVHNSNVANKLDPRVPSTTTGTSTGLTGNTHTTGTSGLNNHSTTHGTAPVHNSNVANKLDPRTPATGASTGLTGNTHTTGTSGLTNHSTTHGTGPVHNSNTANQLDPRVSTHGTAAGTGTGVTGNTHTTGTSGLNSHSTTGYNNTSGPGPASRTAGPHSSNIANKVDPMTDSDLSSTRNSNVNTTTGTSGLAHGAHGTGFNNSGPGPAPNTAGPHKSDMMNKLDPTVNSKPNESKTIGGDSTYTRP